MKLFVYSLNYYPELTGIGKYNGEMASWFVDEDWSVDVITAPPYYPEWKVHQGYSGLNYSSEVKDGVWIHRCPIYIPNKLTIFRRILHLLSFAFTSSIKLFSLWKKKPDLVFVVEPTLFTAPVALLFCALRGSKAVLHVQDFEVDAVLGLGMLGRSGRLVRHLAHFTESLIVKRFDKVSSISYSMLEKAKQKGVDEDKLVFFPNWSDTSFVCPGVDGSAIRRSWGVDEEDKVILYAGNIGLKQGLEMVLDAAEYFQGQRSVKFFLVGSGAYADELKKLVQKLSLHNVKFKPLQAWESVPAMLSMADVHIVVQKKGAADAVLPSKLTNILSVGGFSVVTAEDSTELGRLAEAFPGIYTCVEPENSEAFCEGLKYELGRSVGVNNVAREYAERNIEKHMVLSRFKADLEGLVSQK